MNNGDKPANPVPWEGFDEYMSGIAGGSNYGLTKREEFAKAAMQGVIANGQDSMSVERAARIIGVKADDYEGKRDWPKVVALLSVEYTDALLAALEEV